MCWILILQRFHLIPKHDICGIKTISIHMKQRSISDWIEILYWRLQSRIIMMIEWSLAYILHFIAIAIDTSRNIVLATSKLTQCSVYSVVDIGVCLYQIVYMYFFHCRQCMTLTNGYIDIYDVLLLSFPFVQQQQLYHVVIASGRPAGSQVHRIYSIQQQIPKCRFGCRCFVWVKHNFTAGT